MNLETKNSLKSLKSLSIDNFIVYSNSSNPSSVKSLNVIETNFSFGNNQKQAITTPPIQDLNMNKLKCYFKVNDVQVQSDILPNDSALNIASKIMSQ